MTEWIENLATAFDRKHGNPITAAKLRAAKKIIESASAVNEVQIINTECLKLEVALDELRKLTEKESTDGTT